MLFFSCTSDNSSQEKGIIL